MQDKKEAPHQNYPGSVLLSDHIQSFVDEGLLIVDDTFDEGQLKRAKYQVRLGKRYYKAGKYATLDENNPILEIGPFEQIIVESYETFRMPDNVVGRFDLVVEDCLAGLGLQTGLQIDPTYYGKIFCPIFNFSDAPLILKYQCEFVSIGFMYTTLSTSETEQIEAFGKEKIDGLLSLRQALPNIPRGSGLVRLLAELKSFETIAARLHNRIDIMVGAVYVAMAFMIAAITIAIMREPKVGAAIDISFIDRIVIGAAIVIGVALGVSALFGVFALFRRIKK